MFKFRLAVGTLLLIAALTSIALPLPAKNTTHLLTEAEAQGTTLTIYSGRSEELVGPIIERFEMDTGIEVEVRYASTANLALTLLEEGDNMEADVFFSQDAGALGLLAKNDVLTTLPSYILESVEPRFRSPDDLWVGVTGRARVVTYNTDVISPNELPATLFEFTDPAWADRVGFAPTNSSFLSHMTGIRVLAGDETMRDFIQGLLNNDARQYEKNSPVVAAVAAGEIDAALVNHYYAFRVLTENPAAPIANYYFPGDDVGNLINVAGIAILDSSDNKPLAQQFIAYLLSRSAQQYFVENTFEYPLVIGIEADPRLKPLSEIETPGLDLSNLDDLQGTLNILDEIINE